ncbi:uncharacterized protein LOC121921820 isoform X2 [Sceloporus undulatus]|uniref:uncharacterized protein LOC121921820 isoform X2 n=1 Tax=Sceloporus undulatus TaxID=8520 RepID=UPI001C4A977D|nr:uncharacterized protein LOC121921820 isoform X2 [Sceloporus undulatus]
MEAETPKELKRLRQKLEGHRENLVSTAVREPGLRKRQVTVGRTPLGECLRQPREAPEGVQEGLKLIDGVELLREKAAQKKKKKESLRLEAANQDGGGSNNKTVPARQREGLTAGPQEENQQPQPPALAPEETPPEGKDRDASDLQKRSTQQPDLGGEDQDPGDDAGDQGSGDDSNGDGSECSSDDKEASDPQKSGAAEADPQPGARGEAQDSSDEEVEESSEDVCSDEDDDSEDSSDEEGEESSEDACSDADDNSKDSSDVDDYEEDKDKGARCDALWADMGELEQKVDIMQHVSQEEVDALNVKVGHILGKGRVIERKVKCDLKKKVIHLWSAVWETPLQAVTALQETLNRFLPAKLTALKKESDCLRGFLQAIQSHGTVEKMADFSVVHHLQNALQDFPVIKMGAPYDVPLKEEDAIKQGMDTWYSALLHVLLKQGQGKADALQEKVDAVQNISLKQVAILKVKIGAVQKQMGALSKIPLKEMMILIATVHELSCAFGSSKEWNTLWNKAHDQVFTLKTHKGDALQELHPLWKKLDALQEALCCSPIKKLEILKEKAKVLLRKVGALQGNLLNPLKKELQLLEDKLRSLRDTSLEELQETLDWMQYCRDYPLEEEEVGTLQKKMGALQKKVGAWQKTNAPLKEAEGVMETEGSSFSETLKAPEAGTKQNAGARRITDQPANIVAKMAVSSSFETANFLENAGRSSRSTGNLRGSVSASVPPSSTGVRKMWHGEITLEERHQLVHKLWSITN